MISFMISVVPPKMEAAHAPRAWPPAHAPRRHQQAATWDDSVADEIAVLDLDRLAEASDVGAGTVERLKLAVDELATAYPSRRRVACSARVRAISATSADCWTQRTTLAEYRRLLVVGGWLSLLAATTRSTCTAITPPRQSTCAQPRSLPVRPGTRRSPPGCMENLAWQVLAIRIAGGPVDITHAAQRIARNPTASSARRPCKKAAPEPGSAPTQRPVPRSAASRRSCRRPDHRETFIGQRLHQLVARAEAGRSGP